MNRPRSNEKQGQRTAVRHVEVSGDDAGRRIDNFLKGILGDVPMSMVYRILRKGEVRVNGGRIKQSYRLAAGDQVRLPPLFLDTSNPVRVPRGAQRRFEAAILFEDDELMVINKPSGWASQGGTGVEFSLIDVARAARPHAPSVDLAHRLDKGTSGCLVLSKNHRALAGVHQVIRDRAVGKFYLALHCGRIPSGLKQFDQALDRDGTTQTALTEIQSVEYLGASTLTHLRLITGRTHQIRAQSASIGYPLAGDQKYGDRAFNRACRRGGLRRLFLHASKIQLPLATGALEVSAPLPEDLEVFLAQARNDA
ncbi:MAG: pseudouridine synthase [Pseudomonadota bacterium]